MITVYNVLIGHPVKTFDYYYYVYAIHFLVIFVLQMVSSIFCRMVVRFCGDLCQSSHRARVRGNCLQISYLHF